LVGFMSQGALARPWAILFHPYRGVKTGFSRHPVVPAQAAKAFEPAEPSKHLSRESKVLASAVDADGCIVVP
jgi:hypothetical protein